MSGEGEGMDGLRSRGSKYRRTIYKIDHRYRSLVRHRSRGGVQVHSRVGEGRGNGVREPTGEESGKRCGQG